MGCSMKRGFGVSGYLVADKLNFRPGGRRGPGAACGRSQILSTKSEILTRRMAVATNRNHQNSRFRTNHNVLFRRRLWQPDSNIKQKKQEYEGL